MEIELDTVMKVSRLEFRIYYYEFHPRTDEQSLKWGEFLKEQYDLAKSAVAIFKRRKYKKWKLEIELCIEYNVSESEYLNLKAEHKKYEDEGVTDYDKSMQSLREVMKSTEKKMRKITDYYEKLFAKQYNKKEI